MVNKTGYEIMNDISARTSNDIAKWSSKGIAKNEANYYPCRLVIFEISHHKSNFIEINDVWINGNIEAIKYVQLCQLNGVDVIR